MILTSNNPQETINIGEIIGKWLKKGDCVALVGNLGSGKTTLTKGIAKGLGVKNSKYVSSPTFILAREYKGKIPLYHIDLYRLKTADDFSSFGLWDYLYPEGATVIEWAERIKKFLPKNYLLVELSIKGKSARKIKLRCIS